MMKALSAISVEADKDYFTHNRRLDVYFSHPKKVEILNNLKNVSKSKALSIKTLSSLMQCPIEKGTGTKNAEGEIHAVIPGNLTPNYLIDLEKTSRTTEEKYTPKKTLKNRDILLLADAHTEGYIGKNTSIIILKKNQKAIYLGHLIRLRPNKQEIDPYYLLAYLNTNDIGLLLQYSVRGQTVALYPDDIVDIPVLSPDSDTQHSIGEKLRKSIDHIIIAQEKKKEIDTIFSSYFPGDITFSKQVSFDFTKKDAYQTFHRADPHSFHPKYKHLQNLLNEAKIKKKRLHKLVKFSKKTSNPKTLGEDTFNYVEIASIDTDYG
jgi:restriction endonuclease S subunit